VDGFNSLILALAPEVFPYNADDELSEIFSFVTRIKLDCAGRMA
jgi:hypothetical protein